MKFIHYLETITGVQIYPLVSLLIFFVFFLLVGIYLVKVNKEHLNEAKNIPLNPEK